MTSYKKGANFERQCQKHFDDLGYFVVRSAGSGSPIDLVCLSRNKNILVQCRKRGNLTKKEEQELSEMGRMLGCQVLLAYRKNRKLEFRYL